MENKLSILREMIIEECKNDYVGLWAVIFDVKELFNKKNADEIKDITLQIIKKLLDENLIVAGFPTKDGRNFAKWNYSAGEIIYRIRKEWDTLHRDPDIDEVVWFTSCKCE